jgi:SAM-dependent methyltransferase
MQDATLHFDPSAAGAWGRPYRHYLRGWLPQDLDAPILEVACGGGRLLHTLRSWGYRNLQGVDLSPEQIALSRQVIPPDQVHEADAIAFLEAHPTCFDLILGLDLIEHLSKDEALRFLDAARGALRSGGRLILQTPNAASPWGAEYRYGDFTHELGFTPGALQRMLALTGFDSLEAREMGPMPHGFKSFIRWLLWRGLRWGLLAWNYIEMGHPGGRVFTRILLVSGRVPQPTTF